MDALPRDARLVFSRHTQIGLLRLLVSPSVMGDAVLNLGKAWDVYDEWLEDPRVEFYPEPREVEGTFRKLTAPFANQPASKTVGDCWLLALAVEIKATLITFDRALCEFARRQGHPAMAPA